ncbi:MAG: bacteriohemerythrin [Bryobacteraceae bacterium]|jgi:hemerythrin
MAFLVWEPSFSVGVWEIDRQHRSLIGLINQLHEAAWSADPDKKLRAVFAATVDYLRNHFVFEESYLERLGYEDLGVHKASHKELLDQLGHMRRLFDAGPLTVSPELVKFLKEWVTAHILQCDRGYAGLAAQKSQRRMVPALVDEM